MATTIPPAAPASTTLQDAVRKLAIARSAEHAVKAALDEKRLLFATANAGLLATEKEARAAVAAEEANVRALALAAYEADKSNRKPAPGVEIKLFKTITYAADRALAWAREAKQCLVPEQLDVAKFEKAAAVLDLDFVTIGEAPKPAIATDLEKALSVADVTAPAAVTPEPEVAAPAKPRRGRKPAPVPAIDDEDPFA